MENLMLVTYMGYGAAIINIIGFCLLALFGFGPKETLQARLTNLTLASIAFSVMAITSILLKMVTQ